MSLWSGPVFSAPLCHQFSTQREMLLFSDSVRCLTHSEKKWVFIQSEGKKLKQSVECN